ncbi:amidohydrolase [Marinicauda algicola]|uniref:Amidohydrolase n=1 Tax=Marinicauda algicola TaxID=2029849 RepID=A0A4S2H4A9_9PROT|nr:amidohydrolase [Marinicauda algicola]TGY90122.1 amidohydrolase [Marinicauda algicola]
MLRTLVLGASALTLMACGEGDEAPAVTPADSVFFGGPIHTGVEALPTVEFVAVDEGRIVFVGSSEEGAAFVGGETVEIDLAGAAMFPGFTDAHAHLMGIGQRERSLNLEGVASIAELRARVAAAAEGTEGVVAGRGWIETHWPEGRFPTREDLDAVVPDRPVILVRADGHALVANSAALEAAGITADTPDPEGGEILKGPDGEPTGMLVDTAMNPVEALIQAPGPAERAELLALGSEVMASYGWTGVHDMSVDYANVPIMEQLAGEGRLKVRNYVSANATDYDAVAASLDRYGPADPVIARAVKLYADGALGSRGAALIEPYHDAPGSRGLVLVEEADALALMEAALADGVQLAVHAIGDRGNRLVLDWMEAAFAAVPPEQRAVAEPRWRIEHAQILDPADIARFAELGVIASMQPSHAIGDLHFAPDRLGMDRLQGAYAWRALIDEGAVIAGGSDAPVERGEARIEFYAATVRRDLEGYAGEGWHPEQAVGRAEALKMFTLWPAYASFREDELGTIALGKLADFSIFDRDLMSVPDDELADARPVMTVVGGEIVWRAEG